MEKSIIKNISSRSMSIVQFAAGRQRRMAEHGTVRQGEDRLPELLIVQVAQVLHDRVEVARAGGGQRGQHFRRAAYLGRMMLRLGVDLQVHGVQYGAIEQ